MITIYRDNSERLTVADAKRLILEALPHERSAEVYARVDENGKIDFDSTVEIKEVYGVQIYESFIHTDFLPLCQQLNIQPRMKYRPAFTDYTWQSTENDALYTIGHDEFSRLSERYGLTVAVKPATEPQAAPVVVVSVSDGLSWTPKQPNDVVDWLNSGRPNSPEYQAEYNKAWASLDSIELLEMEIRELEDSSSTTYDQRMHKTSVLNRLKTDLEIHKSVVAGKSISTLLEQKAKQVLENSSPKLGELCMLMDVSIWMAKQEAWDTNRRESFLKALMLAANEGKLIVRNPETGISRMPKDVLSYCEYTKPEHVNEWLEKDGSELKWKVETKDVNGLTNESDLKPLQRAAAQDKMILAEIEKLGFPPREIPKNIAGKAGVKASIRDAVSKNNLFAGTTVFDKAWVRMTQAGDIAYKK